VKHLELYFSNTFIQFFSFNISKKYSIKMAARGYILQDNPHLNLDSDPEPIHIEYFNAGTDWPWILLAFIALLIVAGIAYGVYQYRHDDADPAMITELLNVMPGETPATVSRSVLTY
jgi:hypothetical protein